MKQYLDLCNRVITEGVWVTNERTGKRCLTVINADFEYDLRDGKFPVLTTKKVAWRPAIAEMLGYLRGYTSAAQFRAIGCNTWNANANENKAWLANPFRKGVDDMGAAYRFRKQGYFIETPSYLNVEDKTTFSVREFPDVHVEPNGVIGLTYMSGGSGAYKIIEDCGKSKDLRIHYYRVQFLETGFTTIIQKSQIKDGSVRDPYRVAVSGVGVVGEPSDSDRKLLYKTWAHMLSRCYDPNCEAYEMYGGRGCKVAKAWHKFSNFVRDYKSLTNWELKTVFPNDYSIDKDWCNSLLYSKETCRWSTRKEQSYNSRSVKHFKVSKDGDTGYIKGLPELAEVVGSSVKKLSALFVAGVQPIVVNGFTIEYTEDVKLTFVEVDQFKSIVAKLSLGIDDRRLIMSAHNPHLNEFACLPACMHTHTFSILDGYLYLTSYQRSDDLPLGHAFNQVQVAWLLLVMAKITGLKPGIAYHKIVNAHIYEDQLDTLRDVQLVREPRGLPTMVLPDFLRTLEDLETWITPEHFELVGYEPHDAIKYEFSV